jgi:membrane protease YdiL (CAAX protease family)
MLSEKPWRSEAVIQFCAGQTACLCLGIVAVALLHRLGISGFKDDEGLGTILVGTLSFQGAAWLLILLFLRQHQTGCREAFGFCGPKIENAPRLIFGFAVVFMVVMLLKDASMEALEKLGWPPEDQAAVKLLSDAKSWWTSAYLGVFAVVIAPVAEEFIFRGMLYPFVKRTGLPRLAWLGVSALFALIHANAATFVPLFAFALALTWLYETTDNLLAPITAHAMFNALNLVLFHFENQISQLLEKLSQFLNMA